VATVVVMSVAVEVQAAAVGDKHRLLECLKNPLPVRGFLYQKTKNEIKNAVTSRVGDTVPC
jgi:hypothetical protein